jgi:hypothetical protein
MKNWFQENRVVIFLVFLLGVCCSIAFAASTKSDSNQTSGTSPESLQAGDTHASSHSNYSDFAPAHYREGGEQEEHEHIPEEQDTAMHDSEPSSSVKPTEVEECPLCLEELEFAVSPKAFEGSNGVCNHSLCAKCCNSWIAEAGGDNKEVPCPLCKRVYNAEFREHVKKQVKSLHCVELSCSLPKGRFRDETIPCSIMLLA